MKQSQGHRVNSIKLKLTCAKYRNLLTSISGIFSHRFLKFKTSFTIITFSY